MTNTDNTEIRKDTGKANCRDKGGGTEGTQGGEGTSGCCAASASGRVRTLVRQHQCAYEALKSVTAGRRGSILRPDQLSYKTDPVTRYSGLAAY